MEKYSGRTKYTDNDSGIKLYEYNQSENLFIAPFSQDNNDTIKDYCIAQKLKKFKR